MDNALCEWSHAQAIVAHAATCRRYVTNTFTGTEKLIFFIKFRIPQCLAVSSNIFFSQLLQVDYVHCLVPDLMQITNCSFYWGKMDRYEAERLLDNKPEGSFLLRDSAQDDFLFSVSFRKYGRSLHARIEQFNHKFR